MASMAMSPCLDGLPQTAAAAAGTVFLEARVVTVNGSGLPVTMFPDNHPKASLPTPSKVWCASVTSHCFNAVWRFSKAHRSQFIQAYRRLTDEQCMEVFPSHRERWRIQKVVGALETYPTQTIRGMAQLIGMSKTRVYETLRDAFSKLEDYGYD
ncbi:uncharacterized protein LOC142571985 isoform X1 [Dermacentor variabilis]|uniref:uncharacterized protein LOC142571985 isoform X1 n=1 Tax=Dermacentor variabilis TaxID=34621 RepID=UPI003F5C8D19